MQLSIFFLVMVICLSSLGCGKASTSEVVPSGSQEGAVGPFELNLSSEGVDKANVFSVDINQDEGAVDFLLQNGLAAQYLVLDSFTTKVTGCTASAVKVAPVWYDSESSTAPQFKEVGRTMITAAGVRSKLRVAFRGLSGCKHLDFSMVVRKLEVGNLQPQISSQLKGSWSYEPSTAEATYLFIDTARVGWLEFKGGISNCDRGFFPSDAPERGGGWLVARGGEMLCRYRFDAVDPSSMILNCFGSNYYGCSVPKNMHLTKR